VTELRRSKIRQEWVVIAADRAGRPMITGLGEASVTEERSDECPFCVGSESMTPPEIYRVSGPDGAWSVRVVPNKYPAFGGRNDGGRSPRSGLLQRRDGSGAHEVVIETPNHRMRLVDLPESQIVAVLETIAVRARALMANPEHSYVLAFKNHGREAGASLSHSHLQILAMPVVPEAVRRMLSTASAHYDAEGRCVFCDTLEEELRAEARVIEEIDGFVVLAPYDSRMPFEVAIYPLEHACDFATIAGGACNGLARALKRALGRLRFACGDVPYTLVLQTAPNPRSISERYDAWKTLTLAYHWRFELLPRTARLGGVEWGTGVHINTVPPEEAARVLRQAEVDA
jgi:UDPglucose--hexose-1-phosphate uridylyltransferase